MRDRSKLLAITLATGLVAAAKPAMAQTGQDRNPPAAADTGRRTKDPITRMLEQRQQLQLTDDQVARLEQIRTKYQERNQARMEQLRRDRETWSALRANMDSARAEVAAVLTPEQEKQVDAMREQWRREWRGHHHGGPHHGEDSKDG
jgi:Spy/CpxP family protein refolding chaperone